MARVPHGAWSAAAGSQRASRRSLPRFRCLPRRSRGTCGWLSETCAADRGCAAAPGLSAPDAPGSHAARRWLARCGRCFACRRTGQLPRRPGSHPAARRRQRHGPWTKGFGVRPWESSLGVVGCDLTGCCQLSDVDALLARSNRAPTRGSGGARHHLPLDEGSASEQAVGSRSK